MWTAAATSLLSLLALSATAHPLSERGTLLESFGITNWAQEDAHPVVKLLKRQDNGVAVGSAGQSHPSPSPPIPVDLTTPT